MRRKAVFKSINGNDKILDLCTGTATQLEFKSKCFDKVLISHVLHEIDEEHAEKVIMEAKRVLKDEGEIIVTEWEPSQQLAKRILFAPIQCLEPI